MDGWVLWFNPMRGLGFVRGNNDYSVSFESLNAEGYIALSGGEPVVFELDAEQKNVIDLQIKQPDGSLVRPYEQKLAGTAQSAAENVASPRIAHVIEFSSALELFDSNDDPVSVDLLKSMSGVTYAEEDMAEHLDSFPQMAGTTITADGIKLRFDEAAGKLNYVTTYTSEPALRQEQIDVLGKHTVSMWEEGPGESVNQFILSDRFDVVRDSNVTMELKVRLDPIEFT